jgi:hypothetical protein
MTTQTALEWVDRHGLDLAGMAVLLYAAWPANGIWRILASVPWKKSVVGRVLFSKAMMIALVLDLAIIATALRLLEVGRPVWFEVLRLVMFLGVGTALWWQRDVFRRLLHESAIPPPDKESAP